MVIESNLDLDGTINVEGLATFQGTIWLGNLASDPISPQPGYIYFNTVSNVVKYYNGSSWINLTTTTKFAADVGDGSNTSITVVHGIGNKDVLVEVYENSSGNTILCDVTARTTTQFTLVFSSAPSNNQYRVVVIG